MVRQMKPKRTRLGSQIAGTRMSVGGVLLLFAPKPPQEGRLEKTLHTRVELSSFATAGKHRPFDWST